MTTMHYTRDMVLNKVDRLFPSENSHDIMAILDSYGIEEWEHEKERVQLGILKESNGDLIALRTGVDTAKKDYRDILAHAEFPGELSVSATEMSCTPPQEAKVIRDKDRKQYLEWLLRGN